MSRKRNKGRRKASLAAEMEKDTMCFLDFIPKDGRRVDRTAALDDSLSVELPCNPEGRQEVIDEAIRFFEAKHKVKSWREVAVDHKIGSFYNP